MRGLTTAAALAALAPLVNAHGYITGFTSGGVKTTLQSIMWVYQPTVKDAGWRAGNQDSGFVTSAAQYINSPAISCHHQNGSTANALPAYPAQGAPISVVGGSTVTLTWNTWAQHPGPTIDYLAKCPGACNALTDATALQWFKIRESGLKAGQLSGNLAGWEASTIPGTAGTQSVNIPALPAGEYVLRHEIIALHGASQSGGAQLYPQCFNIAITGSGSFPVPAGITADKFYTSTDPGILTNIYNPMYSTYTIPGPKLAAGIVNVP